MNNELYTFFLNSKENLPILYYTIVFFFSVSAATFLNVLLFRMPIIMNNGFIESIKLYLELKEIPSPEELKESDAEYNTLGGRSFCPSCKDMIPIWYNIPILGWLMLRGKSKCCKKPIPFRYIFIEAAFTSSVLTTFYFFDFIPASFISLFMFFGIAVSHIDLKTQLIPDEYSYILLWLGIAFSYFEPSLDFELAVGSALFAYIAMYSLDYLMGVLRGSGMGLGDIKLYSACAVWVTFYNFHYLMLGSAVIGIILFMIPSVKRINGTLNKDEMSVPFAPAIIITTLIMLINNLA